MRPTFAPLTLALLALAAQAQTADNPLTGKALFENTPVASGKAAITMSCPACHGSVQDRRAKISVSSGGIADSNADITFSAAMTRFTQALASQPDMRPFQALDVQQVRDIAAYLADTPKTTPTSESQLNFSAALNGNSAAQAVSLKHSTAVSENLQVTSVAVVGTGAANFVIGNRTGCEGVTLTPAGSCSITVTYAPTTGTVSTPDLVFTMKQGSSTTTFERVLFLNGSIAATTPAADAGGGGSLGGAWLAALGLAVVALARRRG